jgi:hypothetical protein
MQRQQCTKWPEPAPCALLESDGIRGSLVLAEELELAQGRPAPGYHRYLDVADVPCTPSLTGFDIGQSEDMSYFHTGDRGYHKLWDSRCFNYKWELLPVSTCILLLHNLRVDALYHHCWCCHGSGVAENTGQACMHNPTAASRASKLFPNEHGLLAAPHLSVLDRGSCHICLTCNNHGRNLSLVETTWPTASPRSFPHCLLVTCMWPPMHAGTGRPSACCCPTCAGGWRSTSE